MKTGSRTGSLLVVNQSNQQEQVEAQSVSLEESGFATAMGPKGFWATGVTHLVDYVPPPVVEDWDAEEPTRPSMPVA